MCQAARDDRRPAGSAGRAPDLIEALRRDAVEVVYLHTPERFAAIGQSYADSPRPATKRSSRC
jgi:hypothetical protein